MEKSGLTTTSKFLKTMRVAAGGKRQEESCVRAVRGSGPAEGSALRGCTPAPCPPAENAGFAGHPGRLTRQM